MERKYGRKYGKGGVSCEKQTKKGEDAKSSHIGEEVIYIVRREHKVVKNSGRVGNKRTKEVGFLNKFTHMPAVFYAAT